MRPGILRASPLAVCFVLAAVSPAAAQQRLIDPDKTVRITVGKSSTQPEMTGMVPLYFAAPDSLAVGHIRLEVTFVSANVKFEKVEAGPAADIGNVSLQANVTPGKNENGVATEAVVITGSVPQGSTKGIPTGLLAYLTLRASPEARPAMITLRSSASAGAPGSGAPLPDVQSFDGELEVQAPNTGPRVVCFFFTH